MTFLHLLTLYHFILSNLPRSISLLQISLIIIFIFNGGLIRIDLRFGDSDRFVSLVVQIDFLYLVYPRCIAMLFNIFNWYDMNFTVIFVVVAHVFMGGVLFPYFVLDLILVVLI